MTNETNLIPFIDFKRWDNSLKSRLQEAYERVASSGRFVMGPEVEALEKEVKEYLGVSDVVGVSSGSDALLVSLMALDIGAGDEVICPSFSFFSTVGCIFRLGATPRFADCNLETFNIDAGEIEKLINAKTKAVIPVHLFGQCAPMEGIVDLCKKRNISIIEDAAQSFTAKIGNKPAGSFGDAGCFSTFPTKNFGGLGDGGFVSVQSHELAEKIRQLRGHGAKPKYFHKIVGGNFRLDALQAAFLRVKLKYNDSFTKARQTNANLYQSHFENAGVNGIVLPKVLAGYEHVFNQYVIQILGLGQRDKLRAYLKEKGIGTEIYYPFPLHKQECFRELQDFKEELPNTERLVKEVLALPIFPELEPSEIERVVQTITEFLNNE